VRGLRVGLVGLGATLLAASPAAASTTFGADLSVGGAGSECAAGSCLDTIPFTTGSGPSDNYGVISVVVGANDGSSAAAPSSGVLVSFSVRLSAARSGRVRVMHDPGGTPQSSSTEAVTLSGTGDTVSVPGDSASHSYSTRLPITQHDLIGFEVQGTGSQAAALARTDYGGSASTSRRLRWYSGVPDGGSNSPEAQPSAAIYKNQAPVQGVIEPDADGDGFGDQSQDQCLAQAGSSNGCPPPPDSDADGVPDASDACPTQSDAAAPRNPRTGCPAEAPTPDTDSDGIPDSSDACPTQSDLFAQRNPRNGCPAPPRDKTPPVLSSYALSPTSFVAANSGPAVVSAAAVGTHVFYKLSEPATTTFTVERKGTGHKKKGKCVSGRAKHGQKACTLYTRVKGKLVRGTGAGLSSFRFMGRLNGSSLKPGSYRLVASARDGAGNTSKIVRRSFTIKHP
jgi:hypothetical protein